MKILSAEFVKSAFEKAHWVDDDIPQVAFLGRSNVGKSSLINSLLLRKGLARTSNTPGRTQSINFFRVNDVLYFADLPGYGYARVSKSTRQQWGTMAEEYLSLSDRLALCIQLVDSRHEPSDLDRQLNEWLVFNSKPHIVVATKSDKLNQKERSAASRSISEAMPDSVSVIYSAKTGAGRDEVWKRINAAINEFS